MVMILGGSGTITGLSSGGLPANSVTSTNIVDGTIATDDITASAITNTLLASGAVSNTKMATSMAEFTLNTKKFGIGQYRSASRDLQFLSWSGTKSSGTIDLLTNINFAENGYAGIFGLVMTMSGLGVCRMYTLTGRYNGTTLTMNQGGNRGAGEDAYLQYTGGTNTFGLQLYSTGFPSNNPYYVWGIVGVDSSYYDNWLSN